MYVSIKHTPNPNSVQFFVEKQWLNIIWECKNELDSKKSPLTKALWELDVITYALVGKDFIVLNKRAEKIWDELIPKITKIIVNFLKENETIFPVSDETISNCIEKNKEQQKREELSEFERKIYDVLQEKIQPALELHGGGAEFIRYEEGVLVLRLTGACVGCPSSMDTVQYGIKQLMQYYFPEIKKIDLE